MTGRSGQLGWELEPVLARIGDLLATDRKALDLTSTDSIRDVVGRYQPSIIVNAAAFTAVDRAEDQPELAEQVNAIAPRVLAEEAARVGALLVHYSTDYVFDGAKGRPYLEDDPPQPLNVYGRTKLEGDASIRAVGSPHLIFRTSWVYSTRRRNFLMAVIERLERGEPLRVVNDQVGAPTWSRMIAEATRAVLAILSEYPDWNAIASGRLGRFNLTGEGQTTWYDFAVAIAKRFREIHKDSRPSLAIDAVSSTEYGSRVSRPSYSVLCNARIKSAYGVVLPAWNVQMESAMDDLSIAHSDA